MALPKTFQDFVLINFCSLQLLDRGITMLDIATPLFTKKLIERFNLAD